MKLFESEGVENITDRFYDYALTDKDIDALPPSDKNDFLTQNYRSCKMLRIAWENAVIDYSNQQEIEADKSCGIFKMSNSSTCVLVIGQVFRIRMGRSDNNKIKIVAFCGIYTSELVNFGILGEEQLVIQSNFKIMQGSREVSITSAQDFSYDGAIRSYIRRKRKIHTKLDELAYFYTQQYLNEIQNLGAKAIRLDDEVLIKKYCETLNPSAKDWEYQTIDTTYSWQRSITNARGMVSLIKPKGISEQQHKKLTDNYNLLYIVDAKNMILVFSINDKRQVLLRMVKIKNYDTANSFGDLAVVLA